jgi:hypothetical protein
MSTRVFIRCAVVSFLIALLTPIFTSPDIVAPIGPDGAPKPALVLSQSGTKPLPEMRELSGLEKYRYMVATGLYFRESVAYLLVALVASLSVSVWNAKQRRDA